MDASRLILRCYAEKLDGQWQAFCLDLCLAAQGDSLAEVRQKLEAMICHYVDDALAGEDRAYADQLFSRRAPLKYWAKYYFFRLLIALGSMRDNSHKLFKEILPLKPAQRCRHV